MTRTHRKTRGLFRLLLVALWLPATLCAAPDLAGRWEGEAAIPGAPLAVVIDIAPDPQAGWLGSVILPGRGIKGAALADLKVSDGGLSFSLGAAFGIPTDPTPRAALQRQADGSLAGEWQQAGHSAALRLTRSGAAQVDKPVPGTAVSPALVGTWVGRYELGGYPREVKLTLANTGPHGVAVGELLIVGKRRTLLPIDHVVQGSEFISLQSTAGGIRIEGRWATADGAIQGQMLQGPFEAVLVLRRQGSAS